MTNEPVDTPNPASGAESTSTGFGPAGSGPAGFGPSGYAPPPGTPTGGYATRFGLVRPYQGRYIAGVCAGLGRATNTDPVLWRVLLPVLTLLGGLGVLLYVLGMLLIPAEGDSGSPLEALAGHGRSATSRATTIVLLVIAAIAVFGGVVHFGVTLLVGAIVVGGIALLAMSRTTPPNGWPTTWPTVARTGTGFSVNWPQPDPAGARTGTGTGWGAAGGVGAPSAAPTGTGQPFTMSTPTAWAPADPLADPTVVRPPGTGESDPSDKTDTDVTDEPIDDRTATSDTGWPIVPPTESPAEPSDADLDAPTYQPPFAPYGPYASASPYPSAFPGLATTTVVPPPPPFQPAAPRSPVRRITVSAALLVVGFLGIIDAANVASVPLPMYFAAALATLGIGMFVASFFGRVRGPITLGVILAICLMVSAAAETLPRPFSTRDITIVPTSVADIPGGYTDNYGTFTLDLRKVNFTGKDAKSIAVNMKFGQITVILPPNVDVHVRAHSGAGNVELFGQMHDGINAGSYAVDNTGLDGPGGGSIRINASLAAGDVEVRR